MSEIELHRKLLGDRVRNAALARALDALIRPGETVVADIGAGTGFVSFLARQRGARHCHLYEYSGALDLARGLARRNRITGLTFVQAHSSEVRRPPRADLVVSETLGHYALEEHLLENLVDARRFLRPGGRFLPAALRQYVAPVLGSRLQREIDVWPGIGHGLDFSEARAVGLNNLYVKTVRPDELGPQSAAREWDRIAFTAAGKPPASVRSGTARWKERELPGPVHGFALWWEADLAPGVTLSTSPFAEPTHWEQVYLPLLEPLAARAGEELELKLDSDTRPSTGVRVRWEAAAVKGRVRGPAQRFDMRRGRLSGAHP